MYYHFTINEEKKDIAPWLIEIAQIKNPQLEDALIMDASIEEILPNSEHGWHLDAHTIRYFEQTGKIIANRAHCTLLTNQVACAHIKASHVMIDTATKNLAINGSMEATYDDITLVGTDFFYVFHKQMLSSKQPMTFLQQDLMIIAQEGCFNMAKKEAHFRNGVKTIFKLS